MFSMDMKLSSMLLSLLAGVVLVGCAKEVEPEAEPDSEPTAQKEETPEKMPLKTEVEDGDDVAVLNTERGQIVVMFFPERAPNHVENFKSLVSSGFYDGTRFHRCISGFMIQGGDPQSKDLSLASVWGTGGNVVDGVEQQIDIEVSEIRHLRGVLSMARGPSRDSASSQFFLMHKNYPDLDGDYSAFGRIISGIEVVDDIVKTGDPAANGAVVPQEAVVLESATMETWPVDGVVLDKDKEDDES